ncbi:hypothetical protein [Mycolicibacterium wolinskyi]|nr:hypothetical protein [Mycolicibacterium wolinskyi]
MRASDASWGERGMFQQGSPAPRLAALRVELEGLRQHRTRQGDADET